MGSNAINRRDLKLELATTFHLCEIVNSPRALTVFLMLKYEEYQAYLDLTIDPNHYVDGDSFADDYLVTKVMSKSPNMPTGIDLKQVAILDFMSSETQCASINRKFSGNYGGHHPHIVYNLMCEIRRILGPLDTRALNVIAQSMRHGPGSTTGVRGYGSDPSEKFSNELHLTPDLLPFYRAITGDNWANTQRRASIVSGSKFTSVPKNSRTDRGICVEPTLNIYLQMGIGSYIRRRLKAFGLDLDTQATRNRLFAAMAHMKNYATIDLKAASDSIARQMFRSVATPEWYHLCDIARSPTVLINGEQHYLEKISSMGNGFTFELESLIFYALCRVVLPARRHSEICVFGDDIIIPSEYADDLIAALNYFGFSVNTSKSFLSGNFFESCGRDYFMGLPVRPIFFKGSKPGIPYVVQMANRLRLYAHMRNAGQSCSSRFKPLWLELLKRAPKSWRNCRVPDLLGDLGFLTSEDEVLFTKSITERHDELRAASRKRPRDLGDGWEGKYIKTIASTTINREVQSYSMLLYILARKGSSEQATYGKVPVRGLFGEPRPRWSLVYQWPGSLDWSGPLMG